MFGDLKFKISEGSDQNDGCLSLAETANWADSGQLQFWSEPSENLNLRSSNTPETVWSEPSEILNLRSPNTPETVAFNIP